MAKEFYTDSNELPFGWVAEYADGSTIKEYNGTEEHQFSEINKDNVSKFYFVGNGIRFGFDTSNGVFVLENEDESKPTVKVTCHLIINEGDKKEFIKLNNHNKTDYKDIIEYHGFHCDFVPNVGSTETIVDSYHIGWKKAYKTDKGTIYTKIIIFLDQNGISLEAKINPDYDLDDAYFAAYADIENEEELQLISKAKIEKLSNGATQTIRDIIAK